MFAFDITYPTVSTLSESDINIMANDAFARGDLLSEPRNPVEAALALETAGIIVLRGNILRDGEEPEDREYDGFRDDVEADADTLRNAGWGTSEDYGFYGDDNDPY